MQILTDFYASMLLPFQPDVYTFKHTNPTNRSYTVQNLILCCLKQQSSHRIYITSDTLYSYYIINHEVI